MLSDNRLITGLIGAGAFIIGGLLTRQSAIEGLELLDEKIDGIRSRGERSQEALPTNES